MATAKSPWNPLLAGEPFLVLDGALGTELEKSLPSLVGDSLWSADALVNAPKAIRDLHGLYTRAGADILTTATYQAAVQSLEGRGKDAQALLSSAVNLASQAADEHAESSESRPLVAASVGPYGAFLADRSEYTGAYGVGQRVLREFHAPRLHTLAESGADILACETIPSLAEGEVLTDLLAEFPELPAWISFSSRDGLHTSRGEPLRDCVAMCSQHRHIWTGVNCLSPGRAAAALRWGRSGDREIRVAYPNGEAARLPSCEKPLSEAELARKAAKWAEQGVRVIGGCCGTGPAYVAELARIKRETRRC